VDIRFSHAITMRCQSDRTNAASDKEVCESKAGTGSAIEGAGRHSHGFGQQCPMGSTETRSAEGICGLEWRELCVIVGEEMTTSSTPPPNNHPGWHFFRSFPEHHTGHSSVCWPNQTERQEGLLFARRAGVGRAWATSVLRKGIYATPTVDRDDERCH
jgi:hypothetical protein